MAEISTVDAWEVLDSRGQPTVRVRVTAGERTGTFTVPSGASTGRFEVLDRRDGGTRYDGLGVQKAVQAIKDELGPAVSGLEVTEQAQIDARLLDMDGTKQLERLGGNAIVGVSGAVIHAASAVTEQPLFRYLNGLGEGDVEATLPVPMINMLSGGLHARGSLPIQDFLVIPIGAASLEEAIRWSWDVRQAIAEWLLEHDHRPLVADEGGYAPPLETAEEGFELLKTAVDRAGYRVGEELAFGVDVAAGHFFDPSSETYQLGESLDREEMIERVLAWAHQYPLISIEDPLEESDWSGWEHLRERLPDNCQLLGDDLLVTDPGRLDRATEQRAISAALVKPNQAGTMSAAIEVIRHSQQAGINPVVSARSGETCDVTIAELAIGLGAGQIKIGSLARSERLAKYNRLLERDRDFSLPFAKPFA